MLRSSHFRKSLAGGEGSKLSSNPNRALVVVCRSLGRPINRAVQTSVAEVSNGEDGVLRRFLVRPNPEPQNHNLLIPAAFTFAHLAFANAANLALPAAVNFFLGAVPFIFAHLAF